MCNEQKSWLTGNSRKIFSNFGVTVRYVVQGTGSPLVLGLDSQHRQGVEMQKDINGRYHGGTVWRPSAS